MNITKLDVVGWEPATLRFYFPQTTPPTLTAFEHLLNAWLKEREPKQWCKCSLKEKRLRSESQGSRLTLEIEWICELCLKHLVDRVVKEYPTLSRVELGESPNPEAGPQPNWMQVPSKEILFEDDHRAKVARFLVAKAPVTVQEFDEFCAKSGYLTDAERVNSPETFRSNGTLYGFGDSAKRTMSAVVISPMDAIEYCRWRGCRLPTEEEWMAAAIVDLNEYDLDSQTAKAKARDLPESERIEFDGAEITSTRSKDGQFTIRSGPRFFLLKGWRDRAGRSFVGPRDFDIGFGFRLAQDLK